MSRPLEEGIEASLIEAGLLPKLPPGGLRSLSNQWDSADLLPGLITAWRAAHDQACAAGLRRRAVRMLQWLDAQAERGACLACGLPGPNGESLDHWLGRRLAWWPRGVERGRPVGLVSSRLGQALETRQSWFTVLRAACAKLESEEDVLLSAPGTTTSRYVERCAVLFGLRMLRIETVDERRPSWARWGQRIRRGAEQEAKEVDGLTAATVCLSPRCPQATTRLRRRWQEIAQLPLGDRAVVAMSQHLVVLSLRGQGNLKRLIRARLHDAMWPASSVRLALGQGLVDAKQADELLGMGAVGWMVLNTLAAQPIQQAGASSDATDRLAAQSATQSGPIIPIPAASRWNYLSHCTRRQHGPWPDQDVETYLDDLVLDRHGRDHSALAALQRIITQRRLIASSASIRGAVRVVSFTAVPLAELLRLRVFRSHRARWDFQPYGICIRRDWLQQRNTRPVRYATDRQWANMAAGDRPFFQIDATRAVRGRVTIDWTVEQEWRHVGDLALDKLPPEAAMVFVPTRAEAVTLAATSPWPIVALEGEGVTR